MRLSLRSDSLDRLPDKKGRIKPRWQEENTKRIVVLHPLLINAGVYFSRHQYPMMGVDALKLYLTSRQHPSLMNTTDERGVAYYTSPPSIFSLMATARQISMPIWRWNTPSLHSRPLR